ncbi:cyclopropane-fatty-acyl-phospholipid synthase family protein [Reinekea marina]|uniref:Class I SAM-dependent methyltransferase n=1 Tax=Reinekea marina TaxID=1310421 RepID=A0ABV7WUC3_9GAMM|nr:cyclopropane-fatty-acyl-phospholipid synthase family protein [Reinekea marina]MBU2862252.1 cyclopropane-fatty-acyl-phospholipid synthase family protein [Reinekea forsetii]MDN3649800.1 cyclopropane-fatty-acyl-phospholipid synthase family protein [Reinekea marina]
MTVAQLSEQESLGLAFKLCKKLLSKLSFGSLELNYLDHQFVFGNPQDSGPHAKVTVHDKQVFARFLTGGTVAAGESYMDGQWDSENLTTLTQLFSANIVKAKGRSSWYEKPMQLALRLANTLRQNSISGSKKNIKAHYDLGNDLFEAFLDPSMMYSSAIYPNEDATLAEAQQYKLKRICEKLDLKPTDHLLEIGTGWGAMAIYAAQHYGCKVTTTTLSDEQYSLTQERIKSLNLESQITLLKTDYRELTGQFDKLVSIEMIEAVGHSYMPGYFKQIDHLLNDKGIALLQCITIADQRYKQYRNSVDFIRKYIFPGGHLPSVSMIHNLIAEQTSMIATHFEDISMHYARTLRDWDEAFVKNYPFLPSDRYDERFYRMWRYYLTYCEGGFKEQAIGTHQIVFTKPQFHKNWLVEK